MTLHDITAPEPAIVWGLSVSVSAIILIRADGQQGQWVNVSELAMHLGCSVEAVRRHCEALSADGQLEVNRLEALEDGYDCPIHQVRCPQRRGD